MTFPGGVGQTAVEMPEPRHLAEIPVAPPPGEPAEILLTAQGDVFHIIAGMDRNDGARHPAITPGIFRLGVSVYLEIGLGELRRPHQIRGQGLDVMHQGGTPPGILTIRGQGNGQPGRIG